MNRVLVTGGAGFLGSHVCAELMKSPDNIVTALDDLSTGKMENIASLLPSDRFEFIQWDVRQPFDRPVDQIFHAACPASRWASADSGWSSRAFAAASAACAASFRAMASTP